MATVDVFHALAIGFGELHVKRTAWPFPDGPVSRPDTLGDLPRLLSQFDAVSLEEMRGLALLDRTDTKYVLSAPQLHSALSDLIEHYSVLEVQGNRASRYRTIYFDTEDFMLFRHHHSGKRLRYKVRSREYVDTNQSFLEVKRKTKRDRTVKVRVRTAHFVTQWCPEATALMNSGVPGEGLALEPKIFNEFYRITLMSKRQKERVTLDLGLQFHGGGHTVALPGIAIAEVKQDGVDRNSGFVRQMRSAGIRPSDFSKYCVGVSMLHQHAKHNRFKPSLRLIGKLMGGDEGA